MYEFTVTDEHNLLKSEIIKAAEDTASEEASLWEWDSFKVTECREPKRLVTGEIRYFFEVQDANVDVKTPDQDASLPKPPSRQGGTAASELKSSID